MSETNGQRATNVPAEPVVMRQQLVWIDGSRRAELEECPDRVWTLQNQNPSLPIDPLHGKNAFLEDKVHDWDWGNGKIRYYSRLAESNVWILVEYRDE